MQIRKAKPAEAEIIRDLYHSVIGQPFCTWNEEYPGEIEIQMDLSAETLYLAEEENKIIGAISVIPENEMDDFPCWNIRDHVKEIARVVIRPDLQGKGYACQMVEKLLAILKEEGCHAIHLSVADCNIPAQKTYRKLGFAFLAECDMYGHHYFLCEKAL